jgi:hypothetical protein
VVKGGLPPFTTPNLFLVEPCCIAGDISTIIPFSGSRGFQPQEGEPDER